MEDGFAKSLVIGLVVGIVCVVCILGLILFFSLNWHRLFGVKPLDAHKDWDVEKGRRIKHSRNGSSNSSRTLTGSFWSSRSAVDEKKPLNQWPSPTGSRTSSSGGGGGGRRSSSSAVVPSSPMSPPASPTSPRAAEMRDAKMPGAFLR
ncbi:hypothetical protein Micbo1qcDRAFT_203981 [Microdochium bolleyi]|uniref:Uncharacterized protein n=1 Tax=Microdochium bolleyi TaxID=196109 RepID=A0A136J5T1_9PEZI|nr:hypothetical protein Micbo1qcDRAFT_203981 [Microdochium bolleyi]